MGLTTEINWTDATWGPWQGCHKLTKECTHCYMYRDKKRYGQDPTIVVRSARATFQLPLARWGSKSTKGEPGTYKIAPGSLVFVCQWSDFFHADADAWRDEAWEIMRQRPDLIYQIPTKRSERIAQCLPDDWGPNGWPNVWLGVSVGCQESVKRLSDLRRIQAAVRFVSAEPLIERVDFGPDLADMDWLIVGGESGPKARPMHLDWALFAIKQAADSGVAVNFKQWGEWCPRGPESTSPNYKPLPGVACVRLTVCGCNSSSDIGAFGVPGAYQSGHRCDMSHDSWVQRIGKKAAGRLLDGVEHNGMPELGQ